MTDMHRSTHDRRPRILVVSNLYPPVIVGGYEVECRDVVEHLSSAYEIDVLTSRRGRRRVVRPEPGVHRILPFSPENRLGVLLAPLRAWWARRVVDRFLDERDHDLVFVWNGAGLAHLALGALAARRPTAYRVCEQWFGGLYERDLHLRYLTDRHAGPARAWAGVVRVLNQVPGLRAASIPTHRAAVCWNSDFLRKTVPVPRRLLVVHESVVHPINAAADRMVGIPRAPSGTEPLVLFVGRVVEDKGVDIVIRALALLRASGRRARLRVVGTGPVAYLADLARLAEDEGVGDSVEFTGAVQGEALRRHASAASVWVIPSRWEEPAPMVAIEAGLARVPVVAARVGGIPELVRHGQEALLFDRDSVPGCAAALREAMRDGATTRARTDRAFQRAQGLSFIPYLQGIEQFLGEARAALAAGVTGEA